MGIFDLFGKTNETNNSDFDRFKAFTDKWNNTMSMQTKMEIAMKTDVVNQLGCDVYNSGDTSAAIKLWQQALEIMPNNDDALKNLKMSYSEIGNYDKLQEVNRKLNYLSVN